ARVGPLHVRTADPCPLSRRRHPRCVVAPIRPARRGRGRAAWPGSAAGDVGGGLLRRGWTWNALAGPAALAVVALLVWWWSAASGDDSVAVIDSIGRRVAGVAVLVAVIALA